ncbi:hypothetical protein [Kosmotoga pacifica]|uniref:DUF4139 domain-containing protein n=1 Tax=Kosmotoga pacifica TaxID=1330330 RepID=A0A0G2ZDT0_9BACT|nr:hypothetical protein [Kosmotoga pacifica]AKI96948.1 hypothetical protein IX53_02935 [Kosmotoga pacifica]
MKKVSVLLITFLFMAVFLQAAEKLYVFSDFVIIVGEATPTSKNMTIEIPLNAEVEWQSFLATGLPQNTQITFEKKDDLKSLFEKNVGKTIIFKFPWDEEKKMLVVSPLPVLRDLKKGTLYYKPEGYPIFIDTDYYPMNRFMLYFPELPKEKIFYSYMIQNGNWEAEYLIRFDELSRITGYMSINLGFDPKERETYVVAADIQKPVLSPFITRGIYKTEALNYVESPEEKSPDFILYHLPVKPLTGVTKIAFLSEEITPIKKYIYRPRFTGVFTGVSIDYEINELPFDLPAGNVQIFDGERYSGYTFIKTHVKGESLKLTNVAKSLELMAKSIDSFTGKTYNTLKYKRLYTLKNAGQISQTVIISDYLSLSVINYTLHIDGVETKIEVKEDGSFEIPVTVPNNGEVNVVLDYSLPRNR